jgi:hypothetical protein
MGILDILIIAAVAALAVLAIAAYIKSGRRGGCGCGCEKCRGCADRKRQRTK